MIGQARARMLLRPVLLAVAAAVPVVLVLVWLRADLLAESVAEQHARLRQQASQASGAIAALLQSARQTGRVILALPEIAAAGPGCATRLRELAHELPAYRAIAVIDQAGQPRCAAPASGLTRLPPLAPSAWAVGAPNLLAGRYRPAGGLPLLLPFHDPAGHPAALVLSLGLDRLGALLGAGRGDDRRLTLTLTDAAGTILARSPDGAALIGLTLPIAPRAAPGAPRVEQVGGLDGPVMRVAMPVGASGLVVSASETPAGLLDGGLFALVERVPGLLALLLLLATLANIWLLLRFNARLDRRPIAALASMTELLARQRAELQQLNATLEARVAARTRDLIASRNQLQLRGVERERADSELREAQKLQAVGQLAGGIAHDFNNLLGSVTVALELLRRRLGPLLATPGQPDIATPLNTAQEQAQRGTRLTARLLAFARRQRLLPAPTDLNRLVGELPALVAGSLGRDIEIRTELAPALWPAFIDPGQVEAALLNLVFNARDAMPGGGVLTLATANLRLPEDAPTGSRLAPGAYVAVRVGDTGAGIPPDLLARVFEPFFTTKPAGSASGLGLSQVHGVALQSGGDVRIESGPDTGTTVTLLLPRAAERAATPRPAPRGLRILVADDDAAVRRMTGEILAERGHHPVLAADATQALAILEKDLADTGGSFDVLLSDYVMPGTSGVALILMAQALQPRMRALLVTGHAELDPENPLGPQHILRKPFTIAALEERLALIRAEAAPARPQPVG